MSDTKPTTDDAIREAMLAEAAVPIVRWEGTDDDPIIVGPIVKRTTRLGQNGEFTALVVNDAPRNREVEVACFWRLSETIEEYDPQPGEWICVQYHGESMSKNNKRIVDYHPVVYNADGAHKAGSSNGATAPASTALASDIEDAPEQDEVDPF